jgi:ATP-dependent RNA helicase RhlE
MDFMNQKVINIAPVEFFVLDEVDRMLDMGFVRDIRKIRDQLKNVKQTYTFSATISDEIKKIINEYIPGYESIKVGSEVTVDKIHHSYMQVEHEDKLFNAKKLIDEHPMDKILIFTQTKRNTKSISTTL